MKLIYAGRELECSRAEKGPDYIRLYGESGECTASFAGIADFVGYALQGGEFEAPKKTELELLRETVDMLVLESLGV